MPIDNEEHTSSGVVEQTLQELNEHRTADATGNAGETEVPLPRYGGDQVQAEASPGRGDYGRLAARRPGGAGVRIRVNPGFIGEPDLRASSFGALPEARVFDLKETVDRLRVLLIGAPQRSLRGEPQLLQEPADRCPAQHNPKLPAQDGAQDSACPQGERKLELPRITTGYRLVDPLNGPGVQFRPPAAPLARIQGFPSAATVQRQPSIYRRSTHTQHARYDFGRLAAMHGLHPTLANLRQFVVRQPASVAPHCGRDNTTSQSHCPDNCEKVSNPHHARPAHQPRLVSFIALLGSTVDYACPSDSAASVRLERASHAPPPRTSPSHNARDTTRYHSDAASHENISPSLFNPLKLVCRTLQQPPKALALCLPQAGRSDIVVANPAPDSIPNCQSNDGPEQSEHQISHDRSSKSSEDSRRAERPLLRRGAALLSLVCPTPAISCEPVRPPTCPRAPEAAPPPGHGAAERLVSFIASFDGVNAYTTMPALIGQAQPTRIEATPTTPLIWPERGASHWPNRPCRPAVRHSVPAKARDALISTSKTPVSAARALPNLARLIETFESHFNRELAAEV